MSDEAAISSMAKAVVERDILCKGCGYNLRTLSTAGICPECGAAVGPSLMGGPFDDAPRGWLVMVAIGLALLIVSSVSQIVGHMIWVRREHEVILIQAASVGPKLWIMVRGLQMGIPTQLNIANFIGLVLHALGVIALTWRTVNQSRAMRRLGVILRVTAVVAVIYWLAMALRASAGKMNSDIKSPMLGWVAVLDVACIVLGGSIISGIARRGGYRRGAKWIMLLMIVQASGLLLLYGGIYIMDQVEKVIWLSLVLHAAGGSGLTIISIWLIFRLAGAARAVRAGVLINDEETERRFK